MKGFFFVLSLVLLLGSVTGLVLQETTKLSLDDGATGDYYGGVLSLSGNTLIVGSTKRDLNGIDSGAAYVYERKSDGVWNLQQILQPSDAAPGDFFGTVSIYGNTIAVGAWMKGNGAVYVFEKNPSGIWEEMTKLTIEGETGFGWFLSVSTDTIVATTLNSTRFGTAYVFERYVSTNTWRMVKKLTEPVNLLTPSITIREDTIVLGARGENAVYVFERNNWGQQSRLVPVGGESGNHFGTSCDLNGKHLVIGAPEDDEAGVNAGAVYIFRRNESVIGGWIQIAKLTASDAKNGAYFGNRIVVWRNWIAVGAMYDTASGYTTGSVYLFQTTDYQTWEEMTRITPSIPAPDMLFGAWIAFEENSIVVGAPNADSVGIVHIFNGNWYTPPANKWNWSCNCDLNTRSYTDCLTECREVRGYWSWTCDYKFPKSNYTYQC